MLEFTIDWPDGIKRRIFGSPLLKRIFLAASRRLDHPVERVYRSGSGIYHGISRMDNFRMRPEHVLGIYEYDVSKLVQDMLRPGMIFYDLGAHHGYFTLLAARQVTETGSVVALEIGVSNLRRLAGNLELNGFRQVDVLETAAGDRCEKTMFRDDPDDTQGHLDNGRMAVWRRPELSAREVEMVTLDHLVYGRGKPAPDLVKVDVEGAEGLVLEGMTRLLAEQKPALLIEVHDAGAAGHVWKILGGCGYSIALVGSNHRPVSHAEIQNRTVLAKPAVPSEAG